MSQGPAVQSEFAVSSRSPTVRRSSWPFSRRGQHALSCCGVPGQVGTSKAMSSTSRSCSFLPGSGKDRREGRLPHPLGFLRPGGSQHGPGRTMLERWGTSCVPSGNMFRHLCSATQGYMVASLLASPGPTGTRDCADSLHMGVIVSEIGASWMVDMDRSDAQASLASSFGNLRTRLRTLRGPTATSY